MKKQSKSPKSQTNSQQRKRQSYPHHYTTSTNTPAHASHTKNIKNFSTHQHQQINQNGHSVHHAHSLGASKKRNSMISNSNNANNQHAHANNPIYQTGVKQVNNYMIDPVMGTNNIANPNIKSKQHSYSTKSSSGVGSMGCITTTHNQNKILAVSSINQQLTHANPTSKQAISVQHKVNQSFNSNGNQPLSQSFAERRLSAKIIDPNHNHNKKGHHQHSKSNVAHNVIQYENLMLQQLLKQQQLKDQQQNVNNTFNKNMSVISIDQMPSTATASGQHIAPHMMLNISYNMNNNINHTTASGEPSSTAQFLFQQDPAQIKSLLGNFAHGATTDDQLQQRTLIEQAKVFKTQVDKQMQQKMAAVNNAQMNGMLVNTNNGSTNKLYHQANSQGLLQLEQQMSYENSLINAVQVMDQQQQQIQQQQQQQRFRDQSFDQIKQSKQKANNSKRTKQQSSNSGRWQQQNQNLIQSRSNSSKKAGGAQSSKHYNNISNLRDSSRVLLNSSNINQMSSHHSNASSYNQSNRLSNQKVSFKKVRNSMIDQNTQDPHLMLITNGGDNTQKNINNLLKQQQQNEDLMLLTRLDEALSRDLQDKTSAQKVQICSKVWSEIIRRQEQQVIASLLTKIKSSYEAHIKSQNKILTQQQKEIEFEQELKVERQERKNAENKIENLSIELKRQQQCMDKQELVIQDMKKQILAYRQEIIELSTSKKHAKARRQLNGQQDIDNMRVPRLDLSKVKRDSEEDDDDNTSNNQKKPNGDHPQNVTYQQYLQFLENESRFEGMGEESQESIMRQEELKQRKNKIIQLLNGEISEDDGADHIEQSSGGGGDDEYQDDDEDYMHDDGEIDLQDDIDLSNPPSTVKKLQQKQQQQQLHQNTTDMDLMDADDLDDEDILAQQQILQQQKIKHQNSKHEHAQAQQQSNIDTSNNNVGVDELKQQIKDFKQQMLLGKK